MGVFDLPKAMYKANQAKKKMSKITAAGVDGLISVLVNGVGEVIEVEVDIDMLRELTGIQDEALLKKIAKHIEQNVKNSSNNAKKHLEQELVKNTDMNELKEMLGL